MNRTAKAILKVQGGIAFLDQQSIADLEDEENNQDELFTVDECRCVGIDIAYSPVEETSYCPVLPYYS